MHLGKGVFFGEGTQSLKCPSFIHSCCALVICILNQYVLHGAMFLLCETA